MAIRPVFEVLEEEKLFARCNVEFKWTDGRTTGKVRKNIQALHENYLAAHPDKKVLEISTKSEDELGQKLSAFNLMIREGVSFESAYQGSKVFQRGGPYTNLIDKPAVYAKSDARLKNSGALIGFNFEGKDYPNDPPTFFYNWRTWRKSYWQENLTPSRTLRLIPTRARLIVKRRRRQSSCRLVDKIFWTTLLLTRKIF